MAYLLFGLVLSIIGVSWLLLRNHRPVSMESSMRDFERGLQALTPGETQRRSESPRPVNRSHEDEEPSPG